MPALQKCTCRLSQGVITTFCTKSHFTTIPYVFIDAYHTDVLVLWGNNIRQINSLPKLATLDRRFQQTVSCIPPPPKLVYQSISILGLCDIITDYSRSTSTQPSTHYQDHISSLHHQPITTELSSSSSAVNHHDFNNTINNKTFYPSLHTTNISYVTTSTVIQASKNISLNHVIIAVVITFLVTICIIGLSFLLYRKCKKTQTSSSRYRTA